jgi:L-threonylcarbamoyladenylate synthase
MLQDVLPKMIRVATPHEESVIARSPGQHARHYAPRKPLVVFTSERLRERLLPTDGLLALRSAPVLFQVDHIVIMPENANEYAARFYAALREMDAETSVKRIVVEHPLNEAEWGAIHDRLRRAVAPKEDAS